MLLDTELMAAGAGPQTKPSHPRVCKFRGVLYMYLYTFDRPGGSSGAFCKLQISVKRL